MSPPLQLQGRRVVGNWISNSTNSACVVPILVLSCLYLNCKLYVYAHVMPSTIMRMGILIDESTLKASLNRMC